LIYKKFSQKLGAEGPRYLRTLFNLLYGETLLVLPGVGGQGYNRPEAESGVGKLLNIGPWEFFLIFVVALIVFGPGSLPEVARFVGKATRELRKFSAGAYRLWDEVTRESLLKEEKNRSKTLVRDGAQPKDAAGDSSKAEQGEAKVQDSEADDSGGSKPEIKDEVVGKGAS